MAVLGRGCWAGKFELFPNNNAKRLLVPGSVRTTPWKHAIGLGFEIDVPRASTNIP
jgi:hypothetical protein